MTEPRKVKITTLGPNKLHTQAGEVTLKVPRLRQQKFESTHIERCNRREFSEEEMAIGMPGYRLRALRREYLL